MTSPSSKIKNNRNVDGLLSRLTPELTPTATKMKDEVRGADAQGYMPEPGHNSLGSSPLPLLKPASQAVWWFCLLYETKTTFISRSGRVVDGTSLENWRRETVRGFKSYLRRQRRQALSYCRVVTSNGLFLSGVGGCPPTRLIDRKSVV